MATVPVFFSDQMVADSGGYSPSAGKPAQAVGSWLDAGFDIEIHTPVEATIDDLCMAHLPRYVMDVLDCVINNGHGNRSPKLAGTLPWTSGSMLSAARWAMTKGGIACSPTSGFHHAGFSHGGGFCTFNGLMVTAGVLLESGEACKVGILDLDMHYGDGTEDIIRRLGLQDGVVHFSGGAEHRHSGKFLKSLPRLVVDLFGDCDVLLYQAGADPHVNDPLGGWMTTEEMRRRDEIVFREAAKIGLPVGWNLAGGYQKDESGTIRPVLDVHDNTMEMACKYQPV